MFFNVIKNIMAENVFSFVWGGVGVWGGRVGWACGVGVGGGRGG
jgi:hypothetical protein